MTLQTKPSAFSKALVRPGRTAVSRIPRLVSSPIVQPPNPLKHISDLTSHDAESFFVTATMAPASEAAPILERLGQLRSSVLREVEHDPTLTPLLAKTELVRAFTLMRHAASATDQRIELFDRAQRIVDTTLTHQKDTDTLFYGNLLTIELQSHLAEQAHFRGDLKAKHIAVRRLAQTLANLMRSDGTAGPHRETISTYAADVAIVMARMELWGKALRGARTLTNHPNWRQTTGAERILTHPLFEPFLADGQILSAQLIAAQAKTEGHSGIWWRRFRTAIQYARTSSLKEAGIVGSVGMAAGLAADLAITGGVSIWGGAAGAALASLANRLHNGWHSEEAQEAAVLPAYHRSAGETAADAARLIVRSGTDTLTWAVPTALILALPEGLPLMGDTLAAAGEMYGKFFSWVGSGAASLTQPETYRHAAESVLSGPSRGTMEWLAHTAYIAYETGAALIYGTNLLMPKYRPLAKKLSPWFLPGAFMLSADLSMAIAGTTDDYYNRMGRAAIVSLEIYFMMLTAGITALAKRGSVREAFHSFGKGILETNYGLPIAAALTVGISSPLGGYMQRGAVPDELALLAMQGAAITLGLLPMTLAISGVLKGQIPIVEGLKEGWLDTRGEHLLRRLAVTLRSTASSFNMPYAHNRIGRSITYDLFPAGVRAHVGWDTNPGQALMSGINQISGNHISTSTWSEVSGTSWERDAILAALKSSDPKAKLHDFFEKSGQRVSLAHLLLPHAPADRLFPFYAFLRAWRPPTFPHLPNSYLFANLHQMLHDGHDDKLGESDLDTLFAYVVNSSADPNHYDVLRPVMQTLALARDSEEYGPQITQFLTTHPELLDLLNIDLQDLTIDDANYRYQRRAAVRKLIKGDLNLARYEGRVKSHASQMQSNKHGQPQSLMGDLF